MTDFVYSVSLLSMHICIIVLLNSLKLWNGHGLKLIWLIRKAILILIYYDKLNSLTIGNFDLKVILAADFDVIVVCFVIL